MDIDFDHSYICRVKLTSDDLQDLASGERILIDIADSLILEIYHSPSLNYESGPHLDTDDPDSFD